MLSEWKKKKSLNEVTTSKDINKIPKFYVLVVRR